MEIPEEDKAEYSYQQFLKILEFNPDVDILKIEDGWAKVYKFVGASNIKELRKLFKRDLTDEEMDNFTDED